MQAVRIVVFLLVATLLAAPASRVFSADEVPAMITDRPDITESSQTVPRGYFQLETGVGMNVDRVVQNRVEIDLTSFDMLNTLLRFGLTEWIELRLSTLYTFKTADTPGDSAAIDGINGLIAGVKIHFFEESGLRPDVGLIVDVGIPAGPEELAGKKTQPGFILAASHTFGERMGLSYNLGGRRGQEVDFIFKWSASVPVAIAGGFGAFAEMFGTAGESIAPMVAVDGGAAWQIRPNIQLDAAAGIALTDEGDDWFGTAGLSFRLPR